MQKDCCWAAMRGEICDKRSDFAGCWWSWLLSFNRLFMKLSIFKLTCISNWNYTNYISYNFQQNVLWHMTHSLALYVGLHGSLPCSIWNYMKYITAIITLHGTVHKGCLALPLNNICVNSTKKEYNIQIKRVKKI